MLGDCLGVPGRRVHHQHTVLCGRFEVHVARRSAAHTQESQGRRSVEDLGEHEVGLDDQEPNALLL